MDAKSRKRLIVGGAIAGGALLLFGAVALFSKKVARADEKIEDIDRPRPLDFSYRNVDALDAIVAAIASDPNANPQGVAQLADQLDYFGLFKQALTLREKVNPGLRVSLAPTTISDMLSLSQVMAIK